MRIACHLLLLSDSKTCCQITIPKLFLRFFVKNMFPAPPAVFLKLYFPFGGFFVLARPVIYALAFRTLKFYQIFLGHFYILTNLNYKIKLTSFQTDWCIFSGSKRLFSSSTHLITANPGKLSAISRNTASVFFKCSKFSSCKSLFLFPKYPLFSFLPTNS